MKGFALVGLLVLAACKQSDISSDFRARAESAYGLLDEMVHEHPVTPTELSGAMVLADTAAHSQKERDIVFALKSAGNYVSGTSNKGISCMLAARDLLKDAADGQQELQDCKTEVGEVTSAVAPAQTSKVDEAGLRNAGVPDSTIEIMKQSYGEVWGKHEFIAPNGAKNIIFSMETGTAEGGGILNVSCAENDRVGFWVSTGEAANGRVRLVLDGGAPINQKWFIPRKGMLSPGSQQQAALVPKLLAAKNLQFFYTEPGKTEPTALHFGLLDLKNLITTNSLCKL